jgi:hypothetical protein
VKLDKRHMAASAVMLVGSIIYNVWVFTGSGSSSGAGAVRPASAPSQSSLDQPSGANGAPIDPAQVRPLPDVALDRQPEWPRNPFQDLRVREEGPVVVEEVAAPVVIPETDPVVGTILYSSDRKAAVIDGHVVRIGDAIGTAKVVDILPKAVIIESPERGRRTLELKPVSRTPAARK